jgi:hypothetical protein
LPREAYSNRRAQKSHQNPLASLTHQEALNMLVEAGHN